MRLCSGITERLEHPAAERPLDGPSSGRLKLAQPAEHLLGARQLRHSTLGLGDRPGTPVKGGPLRVVPSEAASARRRGQPTLHSLPCGARPDGAATACSCLPRC
eukprot:scaffold28678_cov111-Isochrysis_galbana.AAC.4